MTCLILNPLIKNNMLSDYALSMQLDMDLRDSQISDPGTTWRLLKCIERRCGYFLINTMLLNKNVGRANADYYTRNNQLIIEVTCFLKRTYADIFKRVLYSVLDWVLYLIFPRNRGVDSEVRYLQARLGRVLLNIFDQAKLSVRPVVVKGLDVRLSKL